MPDHWTWRPVWVLRRRTRAGCRRVLSLGSSRRYNRGARISTTGIRQSENCCHSFASRLETRGAVHESPSTGFCCWPAWSSVLIISGRYALLAQDRADGPRANSRPRTRESRRTTATRTVNRDVPRERQAVPRSVKDAREHGPASGGALAAVSLPVRGNRLPSSRSART